MERDDPLPSWRAGGHPAVAEAFLATRMGGQWGAAFGTLPTGLDLAPILERALVKGRPPSALANHLRDASPVAVDDRALWPCVSGTKPPGSAGGQAPNLMGVKHQSLRRSCRSRWLLEVADDRRGERNA